MTNLSSKCSHGNDEFVTGQICAICERDAEEVATQKRLETFRVKQAIEKEALEIKCDVYRDLIIMELRKHDHAATRSGHSLLVNGVSVSHYLSFESSVISHRGRHGVPTVATPIIVVTDRGYTKKNFKLRKNGSYNIPLIAEKLVFLVANKKVSDERYATTNKNGLKVVKFYEESKAEKYSGTFTVRATSDVDKPLNVSVNMNRLMTVDQALKLHRLLVDNGYIKEAF